MTTEMCHCKSRTADGPYRQELPHHARRDPYLCRTPCRHARGQRGLAAEVGEPSRTREDIGGPGRIVLTPKIWLSRLSGPRGNVFVVPDRLPRLDPDRTFAVVRLPVTANWSEVGRVFSLADRGDRARGYESVLREGAESDLEGLVDGVLLIDQWDGLMLPRYVRAAWASIITIVTAPLGRRAEPLEGMFRLFRIGFWGRRVVLPMSAESSAHARDAGGVTRVSVSAGSAREAKRLRGVVDAAGEGRVELHRGALHAPVSTDLLRVLRAVTDAVNSGSEAVTVVVVGDAAGTEGELTSQQAADLLNVSRPHVVKLAREGSLPHRKVGNRHRFLAADIESYRQAEATRRAAVLADMAPEDGYTAGDF